MRVKKKLLMVLLCCAVMVNTTGCGLLGWKISNALDSITNKHTANSINGKCNDILSMGCNADTEAQVELLQEATDKLSNQGTTWNPFKAMTDDTYCMPWNKQRQNEKLTKAVDNETVELDRALAKDEAYQKNKSVKTGKVVKVILIVALALVLLLLLYKLLKRRKRPKAVPAPVAPAAPVAANHTGLLNAGDTARKNLQDLCSANGIDYNRAVAKFGDDEKGLTKAYMKLSAKVNAGDMEGVEELLS